jgi:ribonucleoside-triphosphate reductase (formate)
MFVKLTEQQLRDKASYIKQYVVSGNNASSLSNFDQNANVETKNVATLQAELYKDFSIQIKRYMIKEYIREIYGDSLVKDYDYDLKNHLIYIHDETGTLGAPYCASIKLDPLLELGLKSLDGESKKPEHLKSFTGSYINMLFALSSQFMGAIATVGFLPVFDLFARKDFGDNYLETHREQIQQEFQSVIYATNQPAAARSYQAVFYNWSILDKYYFEGLFGNYCTPEGDTFIWESVDKLQKFFLTWFSKERTKAVLTFPVVTATLLTDKKGNVMDESYYDYLSQELSDGNSFFIYLSDSVNSLSSCCRLKSEIDVFNYTMGNVSIDTGSIQVITINMNRMVQMKIKLEDILGRVHKYLHCYKEFYTWFLNNNMLPAYSNDYINMKNQFITVGLNGVLEAAESLGMTGDDNWTYKNWLKTNLEKIKKANKKFSTEIDFKINTEFVPAEGLGVKNYKWDKEDGFKVPTTRNCYNSYFFPVEDEHIGLIDKMILYSEDITSNLDGGSALHINLKEYADKDSYKRLIGLAGKLKVPFFGINVPNTRCNDCGIIDKRKLNECPKCGSQNLDYVTRIIGYLKKISSFSQERQLEEKKRHYGVLK